MFYMLSLLRNSKKCSGIGVEGFEASQNQAALWFQINIPFELKEHSFTEVLYKLHKENDKEKLIVLTSCRNKIKTF